MKIQVLSPNITLSSLKIMVDYFMDYPPEDSKAEVFFTDNLDLEVVVNLKKNNPKAVLVGFGKKDPEVIFKQMIDLRANIVFNENLKGELEVFTLDGARYLINEWTAVRLVEKLLVSKFYKTLVNQKEIKVDDVSLEVLNTYPQYEYLGMIFGTCAIRQPHGGFITTTRGKAAGAKTPCFVKNIDHKNLTINSSAKATLNAPLLDQMFNLNPEFKILVHGHELKGKVVHSEYEFAGTEGDLKFAKKVKSGEEILLPHHGFLVGFNSISEYRKYIHGK